MTDQCFRDVSRFFKRPPGSVQMQLLAQEDALIQGNKFYKLKYNVLEMRRLNKEGIITYGGPWSNHIAAVAAAGKQEGFKTVGIIRGEPVANQTLNKAREHGMDLRFVSRGTFREYREMDFENDEETALYVLPEGGSNALAVKGCTEILTAFSHDAHVICCPVGTGATLAGVICSAKPGQEVVGFSALKGGEFLTEDVSRLIDLYVKDGGTGPDQSVNWRLETAFHFGGYAKVDQSMVRFCTVFKQETGVELDYIYTGKMMRGLEQMLKEEKFKNKLICCLHTGGLQGNAGFNLR